MVALAITGIVIVLFAVGFLLFAAFVTADTWDGDGSL